MRIRPGFAASRLSMRRVAKPLPRLLLSTTSDPSSCPHPGDVAVARRRSGDRARSQPGSWPSRGRWGSIFRCARGRQLRPDGWQGGANVNGHATSPCLGGAVVGASIGEESYLRNSAHAGGFVGLGTPAASPPHGRRVKARIRAQANPNRGAHSGLVRRIGTRCVTATPPGTCPASPPRRKRC